MERFYSFLIMLVCIFGLGIGPARADSSVQEELQAMRGQMEAMQKRMAQLEEQLSVQEQQRAADLVEKQAAADRLVPAKWMPDIGVVADTLFTLNSAKTDESGADRLDVRELELVLGSAVDPYSRLDATVAFSTSEDEPVHMEEAYLTRFALPLDTTARIGKFKPKVGKAMLLHRDSLDTVDEPLVIQRYFSEEGFSKSGVDLSKNLDLPIPVAQQLSLGVLEGGNHEEEGIFGETKRRPTFYGHLKNYVDINDVTGFELGGSYMLGSRDEDSSMEVRVLSADATLTHNINANQKIKLQGEVFNVDRKESFAQEDDGMGGSVFTELDGNIWGAYVLLDLRVHPQWSLGGRYDYVEPIAVEVPEEDVRKYDRGYSGYLTFHQSEFARWRAQFTHTDLATGKDDNAVYLQGTFAIGQHTHKLQ